VLKLEIFYIKCIQLTTRYNCRIQPSKSAKNSHENSYRGETLQMWCVWEIIFPRINTFWA